MTEAARKALHTLAVLVLVAVLSNVEKLPQDAPYRAVIVAGAGVGMMLLRKIDPKLVPADPASPAISPAPALMMKAGPPTISPEERERFERIVEVTSYCPVAGPSFRSDRGTSPFLLADNGAIFRETFGLDPAQQDLFLDGAMFGDVVRHLSERETAFVTVIRRPLAGRLRHALEMFSRRGEVEACSAEEDPDGKYGRLIVAAIGSDDLPRLG